MKNFIKTLIFSIFAITTYAQQATEIDSKSVKLPRYATEAAVTAAIPAPTQGMLIFRNDTKSNWYYDGFAWKDMAVSSVSVPSPLYLTSTGTTIAGETNQADKAGVMGINTTTGLGYAVLGKTTSTNPDEHTVGVKGENLSTNGIGYGVMGRHEGTGWAGYFEGYNALKTLGNTYLNGDVGIGTDSPFGKLTVNTQSVNWNFPSLLLTDDANDNTGGAILQFRNLADKRMHLQSHFGTLSDGTDSYMTFSHNAFYNMRLRGDGNLGIGSLNPNLAGLVVNKKVGNSHAIFGDNTSGVSIESNFPGIHFNSYYNGSRKTISTGFTAGAEMNPTTGEFSIYTSPFSTTAGSTVSVFERLKITKDGVVNVGPFFNLNNPNALNTGVSNNISFGGSNYTTGFISTIGTSNSAARMAFYTGYSFTGGANNMFERMSISNTGNVGIGSSDPIEKLDLNGNLKIIGELKPSGVSGQIGQVLKSNGNGTMQWASSSTTPTYAVGDYIQGGIVFWVNSSGEHGKVISLIDLHKNYFWSNIQSINYAINEGNGAGNTVVIINQIGHTASAAELCSDFSYAGYDDWYLPSINELNQIYLNKVTINATLIANGEFAINNSYYWSSNEVFANGLKAYYLDWNTGIWNNVAKSTDFGVRAIQAF